MTNNHPGTKDGGAYFVIDPDTYQVTVPPKNKVIGTVGNHLSQQITFESPRLIDGHDISQCQRKFLTWQNANGQIGHDGLTVSEETDDKVYLTWIVREGLTIAKGLVGFSVHFEDDPPDEYRWGTTTCKSCEILEGINAVLGTYEAMYVSSEMLVIADYTPVVDGELAMDSSGLMPEGTLEITKNGTHDVGSYAAAHVAVEAPTGTLEITENGTHDVLNYADAKVAVPQPTGTKTITENGKHDVKAYEYAMVDVPQPSGAKRITENGRHDVTDFMTAEVDVPLETPKITVKADGTITAAANGKTATTTLSQTHDQDFQPSKIIGGETIFGVTGTASYPRTVYVRFTVNKSSEYEFDVEYLTHDAKVEHPGERFVYKKRTLKSGDQNLAIPVLAGSLIYVVENTNTTDLLISNLINDSLGADETLSFTRLSTARGRVNNVVDAAIFHAQISGTSSIVVSDKNSMNS